jgi:Cof subfamily protein (haloacid dehalogenase superfamily)
MDYSNFVLFSDLDGTLFNSNTMVSEENKKAIHKFQEGGGLFAVSTGRTQYKVKSILSDIVINAPSILYNGSGVYDFNKDSYIKTYTVDKRNIDTMLSWVMKDIPEINIQVYTEYENLFISSLDTINHDFVTNHKPCKISNLDIAWKEEWLKVLFQGRKERLDIIADKFINNNFANQLDFVYSSDEFFEILPKGINKGSSLNLIKELPEVKNRIICAIGDFNNDVELLSNADISFAPSNALDEVKKIANFITRSNDEHAIDDVINNFLPAIKGAKVPESRL